MYVKYFDLISGPLLFWNNSSSSTTSDFPHLSLTSSLLPQKAHSTSDLHHRGISAVHSKLTLLSDSPFYDSGSPLSNSGDEASVLSFQPIQAKRTVSVETSGRGVSGLFSSVMDSFTKKKRLAVSPISHTELIDRFKRFMVTAVDLFVHSGKSCMYTP